MKTFRSPAHALPAPTHPAPSRQRTPRLPETPQGPRPRQRWRRVGSAVFTLAVLAGLGLAIAIGVVPGARGGQSLVVKSGSMVPFMQIGDIVAVEGVTGFDHLTIGDVVTYQPNPNDPSLITHRYIGAGPMVTSDVTGASEPTILTQGDANSAVDEPVREKQLRGRVMYVIPKLGGWLQWRNFTKPFWLVLLAGALLVYAAGALLHAQWQSRRTGGQAQAPAVAAPAALSPGVAPSSPPLDYSAGPFLPGGSLVGLAEPEAAQARSPWTDPVGGAWRPAAAPEAALAAFPPGAAAPSPGSPAVPSPGRAAVRGPVRRSVLHQADRIPQVTA
jgi:signal peptidase